MHILAIETTGFFCSVALIDDKERIIQKKSLDRFNHLKELTPMIRDILNEKNLMMSSLDAVAVSAGPGSFTGIRIGVSTARGISQVTKIPCMQVPTIKAFALQDFQKLGEKDELIGENVARIFVSCPVFDARRKQVYSGAYANDKQIVAPGAYDVNEFIVSLVNQLDIFAKKFEDEKKKMDITLSFKGDGVAVYKDEIAGKLREIFGDEIENEPSLKDEDNSINVKGFLPKVEFRQEYQDAVGVAMLAKEMYEKGELLKYSEVLPIYMRKPEAQRNLEERLKNKK